MYFVQQKKHRFFHFWRVLQMHFDVIQYYNMILCQRRVHSDCTYIFNVPKVTQFKRFHVPFFSNLRRMSKQVARIIENKLFDKFGPLSIIILQQ